MTIYLTPYDRSHPAKLPTGPSEDCGLDHLAAAVELFGAEWVNWHPRCITYPEFAVSDFVLRLEP